MIPPASAAIAASPVPAPTAGSSAPTPGIGPPPADGPRPVDRSGFTLLELMIVTVLLGILAMVALPVYQHIRSGAARGALTEQLRTLAQAQRMHFLEFDAYTDDPDDLDYRPAADLQLEIRIGSGGGGGVLPDGGPPGGGPPAGGSGPGDGWSARLTDSGHGVRCAVFYGSTVPYEPASVEGEIACDEEG